MIIVRLDIGPLLALKAKIKPEAAKIVAKATHKAEAYAKAFAPVDTGALKNSISSHQDQPLLWHIQDGPGRDGRLYGIYQEMGTYKMSAHPFFIPAIEKVEGELLDMFMGLFK